MIKKLQLCQPSITSHPDIALPMSIFSTIPYIEKWLCSEFLQIYSNGVYIKRYNYGSCEIYEPLECIRIPYHIDIGSDIIDFFISTIKNDYYVLVFCDNSQITTMHTDSKYLHGILLYGFDDEAKTFDAFAYNGIKLQHYLVNFNDMINAYNSDFALNFTGRGKIYNEQSGKIRRIHMESHMLVLYKIKQFTYETHSINLEKIKWHMLDYLESVNTLSREVPNFGDEVNAWGLDVYNEFKLFCQRQSQQHAYIGNADTYCIYEHKRDWFSKLQYLNQTSELKCSNDLLNDLDELIKQAKMYVNLIMKYNIKLMGDTTELVNHIIYRIDKMQEIEKSVLNRYYDQNRSIFESF